METIIPDWPGLPSNVGALSTLRRGGVSVAPFDDGVGGGGLNLRESAGDGPQACAQNRRLLQTLLPGPVRWLDQVHGTVVVELVEVVELADAALLDQTRPPKADASFCVSPGLVCAVQTADCLPVLFADAAGRVVGAAHAGWRGLAAGVLQQTVAQMRAAGAGEIGAWLGPAIGPQNFEVGQEVFDAFADASAFVPIAGKPGKYLADLYRLAKSALRLVDVERVFGGGFCTYGDRSRFYSYRRDGVTGRMASLIWIK